MSRSDIGSTKINPNGHIANIGVHGKPVDLQIQKRLICKISVTMGVVNTNTTPMLLKTITSDKIEPKKLIMHHFKMDDLLYVYEVFGNGSKKM